MSRLIDIDDERLWDILFDEACVEGKHAERIKNKLEKIVAFDTEKVVEQLDEASYLVKPRGRSSTDYADTVVDIGEAIDIVKKGGVE